MTIKFWGVRGSLPCPITPSQYKDKLSSVIQRIQPKDIESPMARERFLANLPEDLFGMIGGNTTCFEVRNGDNDLIIVDGGTGIRELGLNLKYPKETGISIHIFFTHFHWDHLQGLPFFLPFFNPKNTINFYSPCKGFENYIRGQMEAPYFPVPLSIFPAQVNFIELDGKPLKFGDLKVSYKEVNHPGGCYSYKFLEGGKSVIFSTDTELKTSDFIRTESNMEYFDNADAIILDAQYTLGEAVEKINWGHTSYSLAVDFALEYKIRRLYLIHHEPNYSDHKIEEIGRLADWYSEHHINKDLEILIAKEEMEAVY